MRPLGVGSLRPLRWSKWIAERDDVSYDEAFQPVHKALEDFKSSHDAEGEPSPIPLVRLGVDETGADRILNVSGNSSSASTKTRSRDSRQPRPQRSKTKAPSRRGDERGRVNSPRSYEIEPCEPPRWQDSPSPYRLKRGRPRPATPSLPRNRVGTAPTPASAGISRLRRPRPRRQPRTRATFVACLGNDRAGEIRNCRSFAEPSDGLEPSTPSLPSSNEAGTAGKAGKPRARKPRKTKESSEEA